jgi:hypothetical protein
MSYAGTVLDMIKRQKNEPGSSKEKEKSPQSTIRGYYFRIRAGKKLVFFPAIAVQKD